jgi:fucose permease
MEILINRLDWSIIYPMVALITTVIVITWYFIDVDTSPTIKPLSAKTPNSISLNEGMLLGITGIFIGACWPVILLVGFFCLGGYGLVKVIEWICAWFK